jgi:hypothetical protein
MKDIKTSCEVHVELADIEEITGKDYRWMFDILDTVAAHPFLMWPDEETQPWFEWATEAEQEWINGWKELREFFINQGFCPGQIIWINVEEE